MILFIVLQAVDILTTYIGFSFGGSEGCPIARFFIGSLGLIPGLMLLKILAIVFGFFWEHSGRSIWKLNSCFTLIIVWNCLIIFKLMWK